MIKSLANSAASKRTEPFLAQFLRMARQGQNPALPTEGDVIGAYLALRQCFSARALRKSKRHSLSRD